MALAQKIAVVTGGNKGIGYAICQELATHKDIHVILTARNEQLGKEAVDKLRKDHGFQNVEFAPLDISNKESVSAIADFLKKKYQGLDILINNAAIAWKGDAFDDHVVKSTLEPNYYGTLDVCQKLLPLVRNGGRVVNVASGAGNLSNLKSESLKQQFTSPTLTVEKLNQLMQKFADDVAKGTYLQEGWPKSAYGVSKIGVIALTKVLARDEQYTKKNILINTLCPGWVKTDMSSHKGPRTPEKGAETPVWLALLPPDSTINGGFFRDLQPIEW